MKINIDKKAVGNRIYNIRNGMILTLEQFGKMLDTSKSTVFQWEKGIALPNKERINIICKLGNKTRNELLYGTSEEQEHKKYKDFFEFIKEMANNDKLDRNRILEKIKDMEV